MRRQEMAAKIFQVYLTCLINSAFECIIPETSKMQLAYLSDLGINRELYEFRK